MRFRREPQESEDIFPVTAAALHSVEAANTPETDSPAVGSYEYFIKAPEVLAMMRSSTDVGGIIAKFRGTTIETIKNKIEESPMPRAAKRAFISSGLPNAAADAAKALGHLLAEPGTYPNGDVQARYLAATKALAPFRGKITNLHEEVVYQDIYQAATNIEPHLKAYWKNSASLNERLQADLAESPYGRYALAVLVGGTPKQPEVPEFGAKEKEAIGWLLKLLNSPNTNGSNLPSTLCKEIADGAYDTYIAAEILVDHQEPSIQKLISLIERATGSTVEGRTLFNLAGASEVWPKDAVSVLTERRDYLVNNIRSASERSREDLAERLGIKKEPVAAQELFASEMNKLIATVRNVKRGALGDAAPQVFRKRHAEAGRPVVRQEVAPPATVAAEVKKTEPNKLTVVDKEGRVFQQDSDKFQEMVQRVTDAYRGTPGIKEDVENILKYLADIDFSRPLQRTGLDKLSEGDWMVEIDGQLQRRPLYRFKATEAPGLSTATKVIKRHRVLLTLIDNDTLGLIGIVHKDKFSQFMKSIGIGTKVRGS